MTGGRLAVRGAALYACVALLWVTPSLADAPHADLCKGVDQSLTAKRRSEFAPLVSRAMGGKVRPGDVKFLGFMGEGDWAAAYVSTPVADNGTLFFRKGKKGWQFRDVWAGVASKGEEAEIARWARHLGAPDKLAACFASQRATG